MQSGSNCAGAGQRHVGTGACKVVLELRWGQVLGIDGATCVMGWAQCGATGTGKARLLGTRWGWEEVRWVGSIRSVQPLDFLCPVRSGKR